MLHTTTVMNNCKCGCGKQVKNIYYKGHHLRGNRSLYWKGGKYKSAGYIFIWEPNHPNANNRGYIKEHIKIMVEFLCRPLIKGEVVHHINDIKDDNKIENLKLMNISSHRSHHNIGNKYGRKDLSNRKCSDCGSTKTYIDKKGNPVWRKSVVDKRWLCQKCYVREYDKRKRYY